MTVQTPTLTFNYWARSVAPSEKVVIFILVPPHPQESRRENGSNFISSEAKICRTDARGGEAS